MSKHQNGPSKRKPKSAVLSRVPSKKGRQPGIPGNSESDSDSNSDQSKIFNDPIHGTIRVSGLCLKIIDTPQFQRLRYLKQLGGVYFVYPGAAHNRFEHSIGTYHLAGKFARILSQKHPDLFEEDDITCIEIAGLCHDLGHGPFSHVFDKLFIPRVKPDTSWKHEHASVEMLEHLLEENEDVREAFDKYGINRKRLELIKDIILGGKPTEYVTDELVQQKREKCFLYEIVANNKTGIDVDKWDYFARDCHMLGMKDNFDHDRYMEMARIIHVDGEGPRICARDKEVNNLYDMFNTRMMLHRRAYQHKVIIAVELMIVDALQAVDDIVQIPGRDGKLKGISECIDDMVAYSKLNDSILQFIELPITLGPEKKKTTAGKLKKARGILKRIRTRDLYKCVGKRTLPSGEDDLDIQQAKKEIVKKGKRNFTKTHFEIVPMFFDYGKKKEDPVANVWFYRKTNPKKATPLSKQQKSHMLPRRFQERAVSIYSKTKECEKAIASSVRRIWPDAEITEENDDEPTSSDDESTSSDD